MEGDLWTVDRKRLDERLRSGGEKSGSRVEEEEEKRLNLAAEVADIIAALMMFVGEMNEFGWFYI